MTAKKARTPKGQAENLAALHRELDRVASAAPELVPHLMTIVSGILPKQRTAGRRVKVGA